MILDVVPVMPPELRPLVPARRRPLRHVGPQRPLSTRHQPQQPAQAAAGAARARDHHPQRKADAAGGRRRAVRQWAARPHVITGANKRPLKSLVRHAQGQAGPLPPEPARQARRLLRPLGHRGRPELQAAPVRPAQEDGARAVQAVHLFNGSTTQAGAGHHGQDRPRSWSRKKKRRRCGTSSTR